MKDDVSELHKCNAQEIWEALKTLGYTSSFQVRFEDKNNFCARKLQDAFKQSNKFPKTAQIGFSSDKVTIDQNKV